MDQNNATPDELQQAINSITNPGGAATDAVQTPDFGVPPAPEVPGVADAPAVDTAPAASVDATPTADAVAAAVAEATGAPEAEIPSASYGDADLSKVKTMALSDLRPILDNVDLPAEKKFKIYKDIIELTEDKACIEPAYNAAKLIVDEKEKAEALLYIIEVIDKFGIPTDRSPVA